MFVNKGHPLTVILLEIKKAEAESTKNPLFSSLITFVKITVHDSDLWLKSNL